jgi:hypothetical protein
VGGERLDVPHCVVELFSVPFGEADLDPVISDRRDGIHIPEEHRSLGVDLSITRSSEGEHDVPRRNWDTVMPSCSLIEIEHERQRIPTVEPSQFRRETAISCGHQSRSEPKEPEEEEVGDILIGFPTLKTGDGERRFLTDHDDRGPVIGWPLTVSRRDAQEHE